MTEQFIRAGGEPQPVCANCDCFAAAKCVNRHSIWFNFNPQPHEGCEKFFPDHKRWPDADHG